MAVGVLGDNVKTQKVYNLYQIINKYVNKVPIFFLFSVQNSNFFPIFWHCKFLCSYFFDHSYYLTPWRCAKTRIPGFLKCSPCMECREPKFLKVSHHLEGKLNTNTLVIGHHTLLYLTWALGKQVIYCVLFFCVYQKYLAGSTEKWVRLVKIGNSFCIVFPHLRNEIYVIVLFLWKRYFRL